MTSSKLFTALLLALAAAPAFAQTVVVHAGRMVDVDRGEVLTDRAITIERWGSLLFVGAVVGLLPITGVPLPFVSYGGSALVVNLVAVGILLSVARQAPPVRRPARR